ncbi:hypothetical protein D3C76_1279760 [compost metagenome]
MLAEDLSYFLRYVQQQDVELNQDYTMYRRNQQQLMDSFHISEPLLTKGGWRFGYGRTYHVYPSRLALIYDYAIYMGYINDLTHKLELTKAGLEWLAQGKSEIMVQIFRFWLRMYKRPIPNLSSLVYWIGYCCNEWVTLSSLQEAIGWLIKPYYYDSSQSILEQRVIQMMMHLGLVRIGKCEEDETVIKMTVWGKQIIEKSMF